MKIRNYTYIDSSGHYYQHSLGMGKKEFTILEDLYHFLLPDYPKFYKMDTLSQLGFILAEQLKTHKENLPSGILIWNKHSSYEADLKHVENIKNNIDGPANFTYTLPNIVLGEIAIRHQIKGECGVFISDGLNSLEMVSITQMYMKEAPKGNLWIGWLDAGSEKPVGFMCDVMTDPSNIDIFSTEIENIYKGLF